MQKLINRYLLGVCFGFSMPCYSMDIDSSSHSKKTLPILAMMIYTPHENNSFNIPIFSSELECRDGFEQKVHNNIESVLAKLQLENAKDSLKCKNMQSNGDGEALSYSIGTLQGTCSLNKLKTILFGMDHTDGVITKALSYLESSPYKRRFNLFYWPEKPKAIPPLSRLFPCKHLMPYDCTLRISKTDADALSITMLQKDNYCIEDIQDTFFNATREFMLAQNGKHKGKLDMDQILKCSINLSDAEKIFEIQCFESRAGDIWQQIEKKINIYIAKQ